MPDQREADAAPLSDVRVWDPLLRLTHWSFALLVPAMYLTAENSQWAWHRRLGLVLLGLLAFRILWGFVGPETARFASFVHGPRTVIAYLRGKWGEAATSIGHSPVGGWSTLALIGCDAVAGRHGAVCGRSV
jgi:cytochrome b